MKKLILKAALLAAVMALGVSSSNAVSETKISAATKAVTSVPAPEMAAKAAEVVSHTPKRDRKAITVAVIKAVMAHNKAAGRLVVSSISKISPESAAIAAATAAELSKEEAVFIATAAATAAPTQAVSIVDSVASVVPTRSSEVRAAVISVVPSSAESLNEASNTRGAARIGPPTSGQVSQSNQPINTTTRQSEVVNPDGSVSTQPSSQNSFPNPNTNPPQSTQPPAPLPNNYNRTT